MHSPVQRCAETNKSTGTDTPILQTAIQPTVSDLFLKPVKYWFISHILLHSFDEYD